MKANLAMIFATVVEPVFDVFKKNTRLTGLQESPAISVLESAFSAETTSSDEAGSGLAGEVLFTADILFKK